MHPRMSQLAGYGYDFRAPETVVGWHREGFRRYWAWKSRPRGRSRIRAELHDLIRRMSRANPLWGAPRIHGELLKLGLTVSQATVSKYMLRPRRPPSQAWRTFLANHAKDLIALDFFTVPTATFRVLFALVVLSHDRRDRKSTRLNSSHLVISYAVFCLKKKIDKASQAAAAVHDIH